MSIMDKSGLFIVIDGIDGCGSTTHCKLLAEYLEHKDFQVELTSEPTSNAIGRLIRQNILRWKKDIPKVDALLFTADRYLHNNRIKQCLQDGLIVICDRYLESTIAYQSSQGLPTEWLLELNKFIIQPDLTFILDIEPELALKRKQLDNPEKFENVKFLKKVRQKYIERVQNKGYIRVYSRRSKEVVQTAIRIYVDKKISYSKRTLNKSW